MERPWLCTVLLALALLSSPARAVTISLVSSGVPIQSGATLSVAIVASGGADGEFVSAFHFLVDFEPTQFSFESFAVGSALGSDPILDFVDSTKLDAVAGTLRTFVTSLLDDVMLASLQTDQPTVLAIFDLRALASATEQTAAVGLKCNSVAGPFEGDTAILLTIDRCQGTTAVIQPTAVPEPGTLALLGFGLLALGRVRRARPVIQQA